MHRSIPGDPVRTSHRLGRDVEHDGAPASGTDLGTSRGAADRGAAHAAARRAAGSSARQEGSTAALERRTERGSVEPGADAPARAPEGPLERSLVASIGSHRFDMWFAETTQLRLEKDHLVVAASSPFVAEWIKGHFSGDLEAIARQFAGPDATVRVDVDAAGFTAAPAVVPDASAPVEPPRRRSSSARRGHGDRRLEDFVVGDSNRLAYDATVRLANGAPGHVANLFIHGACGLGKTHLLRGLCQQRKALFPQERVRYTTGEQFTNEYIASVRSNSIETFRARIRRLDLLAIDDIHFLSNKTATQGEFLHTIDAIDLSGARVVLASDEHPRQIRSFSQALVSRFLSGMVVRVDPPDRDMRMQLIRRCAARRGLRLAGPAEDAIASNFAASAREIEGAVTKLAALHQLQERDGDGAIGMVIVDQLLSEQAPQTVGPVRFSSIVDRTCERIGVDRNELLGNGRHRRVVVARGVIAYLARELTTMSFPEIARGLGRGTHSSVHTADQRIRRQIADAHVLDGLDGRQVSVSDLVDQLRHAIRGAAANGGG